MALSTLAHQQQVPGFDGACEFLHDYRAAAAVAPNVGQQRCLLFNGHAVPEFARLWRELGQVNIHHSILENQ